MFQSKVSCSVDLVEAAVGYLDLINEVDKFGQLYRGSLLSNAVRRYETLWLPMASGEDTSEIAAPLDIEWVWYLHILSPRVYESDCKRLVSKIIDHKVLVGEDKKKASQKAANLWKKHYPNEPFEVNLDSVSSSYAAPNSELSCDLVRTALILRNFTYQVSLPHYYDRKFLGNAVKRYKKFLRMQRTAPDQILIPANDIDLIWHAHIAHPLSYRKDCLKLFKGTLDHDHENHSPTGDPTSLCAAAITQERWNATYGDIYVLTGSSARREAPPLLPKAGKDPYKDLATPIYTLKLIKAEVHDFPEDSKYVLSLSQNSTTDIEKTVTKVTGGASCINDDDGIVSFSSAAVNSDAPMMLRVNVTLADTTKTNNVPLLFFPESLDAVLKENDFTRPKVSKRAFKIIPPIADEPGKVSLTFQILPPLRTGNYSLHVNPYDTDIQVPDMVSGLSHPYSVAASFMDEGPCNVALFGVSSYSDTEVFKCRVVESMTSLVVAVEISELNGRVVASTHSLSKGEIPYKGQVAKKLNGFPYNGTQCEPKLLVRGRRDWGVCYARSSLSSRRKLYLFHLDSKTKVEILQPSKTTYRFRLEGAKEYITIDSLTGHIDIPRCITVVPEILALCFSLRILKSADITY